MIKTKDKVKRGKISDTKDCKANGACNQPSKVKAEETQALPHTSVDIDVNKDSKAKGASIQPSKAKAKETEARHHKSAGNDVTKDSIAKGASTGIDDTKDSKVKGASIQPSKAKADETEARHHKSAGIDVTKDSKAKGASVGKDVIKDSKVKGASILQSKNKAEETQARHNKSAEIDVTRESKVKSTSIQLIKIKAEETQARHHKSCVIGVTEDSKAKGSIVHPSKVKGEETQTQCHKSGVIDVTKDSKTKGASIQPSKVRVEEVQARHHTSTEISSQEGQHIVPAARSKFNRGTEKTNASSYQNTHLNLDQLKSQASADKPSGAMGTSSVVGPGTKEENKYVCQVGRIKLLIYKESIVEIQNMDAVVNAANDRLAHDGGVALFVSKAAGKSMDDECTQYIRKHGQLSVSDVFVSRPGKMTCKGIFHAVGPRWSDYIGSEDKCAEDLYNTVFKCLERMDERKWKTIALCAISSGISGVPRQLCTAMYMKAIEDFTLQKPNRELEIHFTDINTAILDLMIEAHVIRLTSGQSPDFMMAFKFPNAKNAPGGAGYSRGYGQAASDAAAGNWKEYKPKPVKVSKVDIEQFCKGKDKLSAEKGEEKVLRVKKILSILYTSKGPCTYCKKKASKKLPCGHLYCGSCYIGSKYACRRCKEKTKVEEPTGKEGENVEQNMLECPICMDDHEEMATLKCSHQFCRDCLERVVAEKPSCPMCGVLFGIVTGTQPVGQMFYRRVNRALPGYDRDSTIEIFYRFQNGKQEECHPNPGRPYQGIERKAFLPDNVEGRHVLELLKKAWSRRLIFTIGESRTTGQTGQITWNDIHHKTKPSGGQFGYPDPTYLQRVQEELAAKGVTD